MITFFKIICLSIFITCSALACRSYENRKENQRWWTREYSRSENPKDYQIIILPPTGGENFMDKHLGYKLCRYGYNSYILNSPVEYAESKDFSSHDKITLKALKDLDQLLKITKKKTILVGASLGGMYASLAFGVKSQIERNLIVATELQNLDGFSWIQGVVLVAAGAPLWKIFSNSDLAFLQKLKIERMSYFSLNSKSDYEKMLQKNISFDPAFFASALDKNKIKFFIADRDETVGTEFQYHLWSLWGRPNIVNIESSHVNTIIKVYLFSGKEIYQFSKKIFN